VGRWSLWVAIYGGKKRKIMTESEKNSKREKIAAKALHAGATVPSMLRRSDYNDYTQRRMYLITVVTSGRRPLFGHLEGSHEQAQVLPTALGQAVVAQWNGIPSFYPQVKIISYCLMPDHFHGILFVSAQLSVHMGQIIRGFKQGCTKAFRSLTGDDAAVLWENGYNDRILNEKGQLQRWIDYLHDNPRRLAMKRAFPDLFRVTKALPLLGITFSSLGNLFLLKKPERLQVQCSRSLSAEQIEERKQFFLSRAACGAVIVSPSISPGERAIVAAVYEAGYSLILLMNKGFHQLQKPPKHFFDACAQGRLLWLSPFAYSNRPVPLLRVRCLILNDYARRICEEL